MPTLQRGLHFPSVKACNALAAKGEARNASARVALPAATLQRDGWQQTGILRGVDRSHAFGP